MNRADAAHPIALGEGFAFESCARETSRLGPEMCTFSNATGETRMLGVADDGEVVGMAETDGISRYG